MTLGDGPRRMATAGAVAAGSFTAYWLTHGSGPFWQDAGLFLGALKVGGGLAPPGYPVYLILGRPFVTLFGWLLPGHTFAEAVGAFSMLWAAAAAGLTTLSVLLVLTPGYRFFEDGRERDKPEPLSTAALAAGALAGLMAGLSYSLWFQALTPEAYAMNACFAAAVLFWFLRLGAEGALGPRPSAVQKRLVILLFVTHGLSCGNHPSTVVFLPVLTWLVWSQRAALRDRRLVGAVFFAYGASGLLPYLYLPWAARTHPATLFNNVTNVSALIAQATGSQWTTHEASYGWSDDRLREFPIQLWHELFAVGLLALAMGATRLGRAWPRLAWFLVLFGVPAWLLPMIYLQGGEYDFWFLPLYMALFVVVGIGLRQLLSLRSRLPLSVALLGALALGPPLYVNLPLLDRRNDFVPLDFALNLYRHVNQGGILFASSDQECALSYALETEGHRPDVIRVDAPSITLPWYLGYLRARYPALHVPDAAAGATNDELVIALVKANLRERVFYISKRPAIAPPENLEWIPAGGFWKLDGQATAADVDPRDWEYPYRNERPFDQPARDHAPQKNTLPSGEIRVVREPYTGQIRRFHLQAHKNLGDWQMAHGRYTEAVAAYERVFAMDPTLDHPGVLFAMGKALFAAGRNAEAQAYFERLSGRLDPAASAEAFLYLGQIHAAAGRRDQAKEYFDAVKRIAPELWKQNEAALSRLGVSG